MSAGQRVRDLHPDHVGDVGPDHARVASRARRLEVPGRGGDLATRPGRRPRPGRAGAGRRAARRPAGRSGIGLALDAARRVVAASIDADQRRGSRPGRGRSAGPGRRPRTRRRGRASRRARPGRRRTGRSSRSRARPSARTGRSPRASVAPSNPPRPAATPTTATTRSGRLDGRIEGDLAALRVADEDRPPDAQRVEHGDEVGRGSRTRRPRSRSGRSRGAS